MKADDRYSRVYPAAWGAEVAVTLKDGRRVVAARSNCKGDPEAALGREEMIAKARELLAFGGAPEPDRLIAAVLALADDGPLPELALWD